MNRLLGIVKNGAYFPAAQSVSLYELQEIEKRIDGLQTNGILENRPHIAHLLFTIQKGLDEKKS